MNNEKEGPNADIIKFLHGESDFYGLWFGDKHPSEPGAFWWRKHLRSEIERLQAVILNSETYAEVERLNAENKRLSQLVEAGENLLNEMAPLWYTSQRPQISIRTEEARDKYNALKSALTPTSKEK